MEHTNHEAVCQVDNTDASGSGKNLGDANHKRLRYFTLCLRNEITVVVVVKIQEGAFNLVEIFVVVVVVIDFIIYDCLFLHS